MINMGDKSTDLRSPFKAFHHQREFSDLTFQLPCSIDPTAAAAIKLGRDDSCQGHTVQLDQEINTNINETSTSSINENDLDYDAFFSQYIDVDTNDQEEKCLISNLFGDLTTNKGITINWVDTGDDENKDLQLDRRRCCVERPDAPPAPRHHGPKSSVTASIHKKKATSAAKLAELWSVDPKRAKRIMANRQSAARSKERKARYISQLERKVKSLQTESTALATQLNIYKEDAVHLAAENKELKLQLQTMEHQAQLQDDLTEAMMGEAERLRFTTGGIVPSSSLKSGIQSQVQDHQLPLLCPAPAADRHYSSHGLQPRLSCQQISCQYWPSLHQQ